MISSFSSDEITYYDKGGKTYWSCGCVTHAAIIEGERVLVHVACDDHNCAVVRIVHESSNEKDIPIKHFKREDIRWAD